MRHYWLAGITFASLCALGGPAAAEELFRYNYVDVGYTKATADVPGSSQKEDGSAIGIVGSIAVHDMVAIQVGYDKTKFSFNGGVNGLATSYSFNGSDLTLGVDVHKMVTENTEVGFDLARVHASFNAFTLTEAGATFQFPSSTDNANNFGVRVRTAVTREFRLLASVGRTTGGAVASTTYSAGVEYELGEQWSVGAGYILNTASGGNTRGFGISGRYYF